MDDPEGAPLTGADCPKTNLREKPRRLEASKNPALKVFNLES